MDKIVLEFMQQGRDINEILDMPYHYVVQILEEKNKPKHTKSLMAAFGGG
ncbi:phage tail assembly chaperone GT [Priestia flexa]|nr:hypothetical protein [Priestia flexa]WEZ09583.1 hypothetical protein P5663_07000 [Priestia flexa]